MVASAASYVVSAVALGPIAADPSRRTSPLSASYLIALAARIVREVSGLMRGAREAGKELATLSIELFDPLTKAEHQALEAAVQAYGDFLGMPAAQA